MVDGQGLLFVLIGLPNLVWPYRSARLALRFRSVGRARSDADVEPADWYVRLTRLFGVAVTLFGLVWFAFGSTVFF